MKSYSQDGEDLFLFDLFKKKNINSGIFIEFGAWDGVHLSNCKLFADNNWTGYFIEADENRFQSLLKNYNNNKNIKCINKFISSNYTLDDLVFENEINKIDVLSIDIDGRDLSELKKLTTIKPMVIVVEFNMTIPFDVEAEDHEGGNGSSFLSINKYLKNKEYELIFVSHCNLIFIDKKFNNNEIENWSVEKIINKFNPIRLGFNNYGDIFFVENKKIIKKEIFKLPTMKSFIIFQPVPKFLRKLTDADGKGYKILKILYSHMVLLFLRPILFVKKILNKKDSFK